jgi:hypothetical protein
MHRQPEQFANRVHVAGLKPSRRQDEARCSASAWRISTATTAKWQLCELDERAETCVPLDWQDSGNIVTRLVRAVDADATRVCLATSIAAFGGSRPTRTRC